MSNNLMALPTRQRLMLPQTMCSTICPVCHIYVIPNWSEVALLPEALPVHCRDSSGAPAFECEDYTRQGYPRTHQTAESVWVHGRCYAVGVKLLAQYEMLGDDPAITPVQVQLFEEIDTLLLSARPLGSSDWHDREDWAPDHD